MSHLLLRASSMALLLSITQAQWSGDAAQDLSIGDGPGDQVQPKIAPTADGGCYVSWFDGLANGFDVRLQRLDSQGNELWAHNGVLVADRSLSSTQDYGLDVDISGAALLAFRDDRTGSIQITAQRVSSSGNLLWGAAGVQLTSGAGSFAAPKVAGANDGEVVVAWSDSGVARLMRLDPTGADVWAVPKDLTPPAGSYFVSELQDSASNVILAVVHQTGAQIFSPRHLLTWKFSRGGTSLWGAQPVSVFDSGSLQIGNFPSFVTEDGGGAIFGWYGVGPLQCYAQHVLADGSEAFPNNGALGSTDMSGTRVSPSVAYDPATSSTWLFWTEMDANQVQRGVSGQRFDASGNRQWGPIGQVIVPLGSNDISFVRTITNGFGAYVAWLSSAGLGNDRGRAALVDAAGATTVGPFSFASTPSGKSRLTAAKSVSGDALLAWSDTRVDAGDVLGQNLRTNGELGNSLFTGYCFGVGCSCVNDGAGGGCVNSTGLGALLSGSGSTSIAADDMTLALSWAPSNQPVLLFLGTVQVNGGAGLFLGDGLRCVGGSVSRVGVESTDGAGGASWGPGLAATFGWNPGDTVLFQTWYRDPVGGPCGNAFNLSNGLEVVLAP